MGGHAGCGFEIINILLVSTDLSGVDALILNFSLGCVIAELVGSSDPTYHAISLKCKSYILLESLWTILYTNLPLPHVLSDLSNSSWGSTHLGLRPVSPIRLKLSGRDLIEPCTTSARRSLYGLGSLNKFTWIFLQVCKEYMVRTQSLKFGAVKWCLGIKIVMSG